MLEVTSFVAYRMNNVMHRLEKEKKRANCRGKLSHFRGSSKKSNRPRKSSYWKHKKRLTG